MPSKHQIDSFHQFASSQIENGGADLSMDELYCLWRAKNPNATELSQSVAAIQEAYTDLQSGNQGKPARSALRESCVHFGLVIDE
jgi:hypothetical protein